MQEQSDDRYLREICQAMNLSQHPDIKFFDPYPKVINVIETTYTITQEKVEALMSVCNMIEAYAKYHYGSDWVNHSYYTGLYHQYYMVKQHLENADKKDFFMHERILRRLLEYRDADVVRRYDDQIRTLYHHMGIEEWPETEGLRPLLNCGDVLHVMEEQYDDDVGIWDLLNGILDLLSLVALSALKDSAKRTEYWRVREFYSMVRYRMCKDWP